MPRIQAFFLAAVLLTFFSESPMAVFAAEPPGSAPNALINDSLTQIKSGETPHNRYAKAEQLAALTSHIGSVDAAAVLPGTISKMALLLDDPLVTVRICGAQALGNLGPAAITAIPKLEDALRQLRRERARQEAARSSKTGGILDLPVHFGPSLEVTIRAAIQRILGANTSGENW